MKPLSQSPCGKKTFEPHQLSTSLLGHGKWHEIRSEVLLLRVCVHIVSCQSDTQGYSSNRGCRICHRIRKQLVATHCILISDDKSLQTSLVVAVRGNFVHGHACLTPSV